MIAPQEQPEAAVDFFAPGDGLKTLFKLSQSESTAVSLAIHRVGGSLILDDGSTEPHPHPQRHDRVDGDVPYAALEAATMLPGLLLDRAAHDAPPSPGSPRSPRSSSRSPGSSPPRSPERPPRRSRRRSRSSDSSFRGAMPSAADRSGGTGEVYIYDPVSKETYIGPRTTPATRSYEADAGQRQPTTGRRPDRWIYDPSTGETMLERHLPGPDPSSSSLSSSSRRSGGGVAGGHGTSGAGGAAESARALAPPVIDRRKDSAGMYGPGHSGWLAQQWRGGGPMRQRMRHERQRQQEEREGPGEAKGSLRHDDERGRTRAARAAPHNLPGSAAAATSTAAAWSRQAGSRPAAPGRARPDNTRDFDPSDFHGTFGAVIPWRFQGYNMIMGSKLIVLHRKAAAAAAGARAEERDEPPPPQRSGQDALALKFHDLQRPITPAACLDHYLDNVFARVPTLALCLHRHGTVQSSRLVPTHEIPRLQLEAGDGTGSHRAGLGGIHPRARALPPPHFDPEVVARNASALLDFLKQHCTRESGTYWLYREAGDKLVRLYDYSVLPPLQQRKWKYTMAMLYYRCASRAARESGTATVEVRERNRERERERERAALVYACGHRGCAAGMSARHLVSSPCTLPKPLYSHAVDAACVPACVPACAPFLLLCYDCCHDDDASRSCGGSVTSFASR